MPAAPCKLIELDTQTDSRFAYEKEKDCCFQWHTSEQIRATQKYNPEVPSFHESFSRSKAKLKVTSGHVIESP